VWPVREAPAVARYLLGQLSEEECAGIEQLCLENDELFEELEAVEAELIDDYVCKDRKSFAKTGR
jgi:hypothetical protein